MKQGNAIWRKEELYKARKGYMKEGRKEYMKQGKII